jgi:hypothetical protein
MKCSGASTCVPVCEPRSIRDTFAVPPAAIDCTGVIEIGGFPGYTRPPWRSGTDTSQILRFVVVMRSPPIPLRVAR